MEDENLVEQEDIETPEEVKEETHDNDSEDNTDATDWKAKAEELEEKNKQLYARLKKDKPEVKKDEAKVDSNALSQKELYALIKADVVDDDFDRVVKYAQSEGITVTEALKQDELQAILKVRSEKRASANTASVRGSARGTGKVSDETIVENAKKGILPDDPERLAQARRNLRTKPHK